jgi:uncharacterized protein YndB with AHSA1/START domain
MNDRSKNGTLVEPTAVRFERLLPGPIERVWEHLTRPELLSTWLCKAAAMDVRSGGRVELTMDHGDEGLPENVKEKIVDAEKVTPIVNGTITRLEPGRALSYTWEDLIGATAAIKSEVTFELEPRGEEVLLVLTHRRVDLKYVPQVLAGWHTLLDVLEMRTRGTASFRFMERFEANLALYPAEA